MPRIFDNIESRLLPALQETLGQSHRADFCVGYFNLRGWKQFAPTIEAWPGGNACRVLVGMQKLPHDELRESVSLVEDVNGISTQLSVRWKRKAAEQFRTQLLLGAPSNDDEAALRRLAHHLRSGKVAVKLFLRHQLHAKLYLLFRADRVTPIVGFLGSSNLTFSGLSSQGELNIDVLDHDAASKLARWFEDRWKDNFCLDISQDLIQIIDESWARERLIPPFQIYVKMAYHLAQEARAGLSEFRIPRIFGNRLFEFQTAAVKIAAHHVNKRGGVLIGDVVGLGKTLMASALIKILEEQDFETLILCPKHLVPMWEDYRQRYHLRARVLAFSRVLIELPELVRYRVVLIDESHNLRNREGKRYRAIREYIQKNDSKCILLSATPYNKTFLDLSSQLALFLPEDKDLGLRPERLLKQLGPDEFLRRHQCPPRSLAAFEKSDYSDDWRDLMRLYLVRRTRGFIQDNYAEPDPETGRRFLAYEDGTRSFFPDRVPRTVRFPIDESDPRDQYARLYAPAVVDAINALKLPRYGLGNYVHQRPSSLPSVAEAKLLGNLSRAGKRLMGFCRTNLFKRLESSGAAFLQSIQRHILRNHVFLHALANGLPLPLGTQGAELLDPSVNDDDDDVATGDLFDQTDDSAPEASDADERPADLSSFVTMETAIEERAAALYASYAGSYRRRFQWLRPDLFVAMLEKDLRRDANALRGLLAACGEWDPARDAKLDALVRLVSVQHPTDKVLVFTQFADTVRYLQRELCRRGIQQSAGVTGDSDDPTRLAFQFSPESNGRQALADREGELRVLVATDVLSEGQNLQDSAIVVNFDLPWAIIRLIQRAGRVDRIGQKSNVILCYSFLPADGVERIIRLRARVRLRLRENAEVVGADEAFFEDDQDGQAVLNLYHEKSGILDGDADTEVDLASYAYQIWKNAVRADPALERTIPAMDDVVFSSRTHLSMPDRPSGVLVYIRTADDNDALAYIDREGRSISESQFEILKAAECSPDTPARTRHEMHHDLVQTGMRHIAAEERRVGGGLGRRSGARYRTYERLMAYIASVKGTLFDSPMLYKAVDEILHHPLRQSATDILGRQLKSGIDSHQLAALVVGLREDDRLCLVEEEGDKREPRILCSLGLDGEGNG